MNPGSLRQHGKGNTVGKEKKKKKQVKEGSSLVNKGGSEKKDSFTLPVKNW